MAATWGASSLSAHWRSILRTIFCSSVKSITAGILLGTASSEHLGSLRSPRRSFTSLYRHDAALAPGPLHLLVPRQLQAHRQHAARVARIDDVVDQAPARRFVDIDMRLNHLRELLL